ncbi:extensin [Iris pallida]|uniref:Extensin n=1 Tax=Iris pallida TaxID=29817 RepID=A0AAX6HWQ3_IRIPA|nr:extensin [Iris pallida]KAJ6838507.1 extensin [Iris pallida]KAJ6844685.1 extensin [Iris pallida]
MSRSDTTSASAMARRWYSGGEAVAERLTGLGLGFWVFCVRLVTCPVLCWTHELGGNVCNVSRSVWTRE